MVPLFPKHYILAKWLINIRWMLMSLLLVLIMVASFVFHVPLKIYPLAGLILGLALLNILSLLFLRYLKNRGCLRKQRNKINLNINIQIIIDLVVLTLLLHFSGGIENPFIIYYLFHMIIAAMILTAREAYFHTSFALLLVGLMTFLEYFRVITHYDAAWFLKTHFYDNLPYIMLVGFIFITTSYLVVFMTIYIVTASRKNEEALRLANLKLEEKDQIKNEYVLRVTHDINGHLSAIQSNIEVIRSEILGPVNEQQKEFVERAFHRTGQTIKFASDLLKLSKRRMEKKFEFTSVRLDELIQKVGNAISVNAENKSIKLSLSLDTSVSEIDGNPFTLDEAFSNLILNAIKYTPEGGSVTVTGRNRGDHLLFEIADTGIGIPFEETTKIFDEFYRASNVKNDNKDGQGLGLSIVKQIIVQHGGEIWVESVIDKGSKFIFTLKKNHILKSMQKKESCIGCEGRMNDDDCIGCEEAI